MARPKHIDFSPDLKYCDTKQFSTDNRRDSVVSTDLSSNDEINMTHPRPLDNNREVEVIVLRDRSNLSLALRKLQCGSTSECLPGEVCCKCYKKHSSAISFISTSSCRDRCEKCHRQDSEGDKMSQITADEVDGSSSRRKNSTALIVDTFFKLAFLKVLIVDIGISIGDTVTDCLQGFNLMFDLSDGSLRWASFNYGVAMIATSWLPLLVVILHIGFSREHNIFRYCRNLPGLLGLGLAALVFPLLPTVLYLLLMLSPRQTSKDRRVYKKLEQRAHEIKSICGSVEAPIQLVLLLFLMIRGILTLPWSEPSSTQCVTDSLGRVACLPSVPMASVIFSVLSIIKAVFDLNIYPLVREYQTSSKTFRMSYNLFITFLPCFLANALFRIGAISLIFVFLDWWSLIPCVLLFFLNLLIFGVSFKRFSSSPADSISEEELNSIQLNRLSTMDYTNRSLQFGSSHSELPRTPTEEEKLNKIVGWVPPADLPSSRLKPYKYDEIGWNSNLGILSPPTPSPQVDSLTTPAFHPDIIQSQPDGARETAVGLLERMQSRISSSDKTYTPAYINEDNTSIFLNAVTGMFFPSCHTHLEPLGHDLAVSDPETFSSRNRERQEKLVSWQSRIYQRQVYCFNSVLIIVLLIILILVHSVPSFNYNTNVISSFWFLVTVTMLLVSGLISILLTSCLTRPSLLPASDDSARPDDSQREDSLSCRRLCLSSLSCLLSSALVLLPLLLSLLLYASLPACDPLLFLIKQEDGGRSGVDLAILTAFPVQTNMMAGQTETIRGEIEFNCYVGENSNFENKILIINSTKPRCKSLLLEEGFYQKAKEAKARGIILLDDTPKSKWRVSSPYGERFEALIASPASDLPFLLVRESDWRRFDSHFLWLQRRRRDLILVWNDPSSLDLQEIFSCSDNRTVIIESQEAAQHSCQDGKHFSPAGKISEKICVRGVCSVFGRDCPGSKFARFADFSVNVQCSDLADINLELVSGRNRHTLAPSPLYSNSAGAETEYCCHKVGESSKPTNSTFLEVFGSECFDGRWRDVEGYLPGCDWSSWIEGRCLQENRKHYRLCLVSGRCENVIRESFNSLCSSQEVIPHCRDSPVLCD